MIKIYYIPAHGAGTREYRLIKQGLVNNPRVELVDSEEESDFIFQFYYLARHREHYKQNLPPEKTVLIDYHDRQHFKVRIECLAYFKRSWVDRVQMEGYAVKEIFPKPAHYHPITMAIMDEFIIKDEMERDMVLTCTLRNLRKKKHFNRIRVLKLLENMRIPGKVQIGAFTGGHMDNFNAPDMRDYFKLLKRSRMIVTCNPDRWEGDHRTWESFASGALVFIDRIYSPIAHPLVDEKHCIFYDVSPRGLRKLRNQVLYFLDHPAHADRIAKEGYEFTMKYHRSSNRIDEILDVIT